MNRTLRQKTILLLLSLTLLPILALSGLYFYLGKRALQQEFEEKLILRATHTAQSITFMLKGRIQDLQLLASIPKTEAMLMKFSESRKREVWTRIGKNQNPVEVRFMAPYYREINWIAPNGKELLRLENRPKEEDFLSGEYEIETFFAQKSDLRDVSDPKQTLFKSEDYFLKTKALKEGEIYIAPLAGWFVPPENQLKGAKFPEDTIEGERYKGVFRFATPVFEKGVLQGVVSIALDQIHLQEMISHLDPMEVKQQLSVSYGKGDYSFLFDHEGWIIAHPKLWDIRGLDSEGKPVGAFQQWEKGNTTPVNLLQVVTGNAQTMLKKVMQQVLDKKEGIFYLPNLGIPFEQPQLHAQVYAPILFDEGPYKGSGVFGGVMIGAKMHSVTLASNRVLLRTLWVSLPLLALTLLAALWASNKLTTPLQILAKGASHIAAGNFDEKITLQRNDEIGTLVSHFNQMARDLGQQRLALHDAHRKELALERQLAQREKKEKLHLQSQLDKLEMELQETPIEGFVFASAAMRELVRELRAVAVSDASVLVVGERGVGKEKIAAAIHNLSPRRAAPYLQINCAALPESLVESQLFGHAKGAFTGALRDQAGYFEAAGRGTLLLDEIGELSPGVQAKLLRVLQERQITRVGETQGRRFEARLLFATNRDLAALVASGAFRADLFDRLHVLTLHIPPLRERIEDITPLSRTFLQQMASRYEKNIVGLSVAAMQKLMDHNWPGNVRELEHVLERAVLHAKESLIGQSDIVLKSAGAASAAHDTAPSPVAKEAALPDMTMDEMKRHYAKMLRDKYPDRPLKELKEILQIDWNTLRKYLG